MTSATPVKTRKTWLLSLLFLFLVLLLAGLVAPLLASTTEARIRTAGGFLQIAGLLTVAIGISTLRRDFGLPGTLSEITAEALQWLRVTSSRLWRAFGHRSAKVLVAGADSFAVAANWRAHVKVRSAPNATTDQRLTTLESNVDVLDAALLKLREDLDHEVEQRKQAIATESRIREDTRQTLQERLADVAVGGIRLQTVGLVLLFFGILLATWSPELARLFAP
jgi:acetylornithine deacetylase/succinyl-diaminopimelate desuccinylase-like protein